MDPRRIMLLAGELTLRDLQQRLRCARCREKRGRIVPHDEEWPGR
jgi:hypothetical protein